MTDIQTVLLIVVPLAAALVAALVAFLLTRSHFRSRLREKDSEIALMEKYHERSISDMKESWQNSLSSQIDAAKAEMSAESEKVLKMREEQIRAEAKRTFDEISGSLGKDFKEMKDSFESNRISQAASSAALKENLENAVRNLSSRTEEIGRKADNLAEAMRAEVKGQGMWGEALFENMLESEGFVKGRDYNREDVLRDDLGFSIVSEEGRGMRPDFVLHYPDDTDVIVDSKVSMAALNDYIAASTDEERADAAARNLDSVRKQVAMLSKKDYVRYRAKSTRKTLDYVLMFIPNYGALQLAKELDPDVWRNAFDRNVLIVTEETAMPFLRMIRAAWASYDQVRSQKLIVEAARRMLDRVADFAKYHAEMGRCLDKARDYYDQCDRKLRDSGQSISVAARDIVKFGVPANPDKALPEPDCIVITENNE